MDIRVDFGGGLKVNAYFDGFTVATDQPVDNGGDNSAPDPFSYFLTSLVTCSGFYVLKFCQTREIATDGIELFLRTTRDEKTNALTEIRMEIQLPAGFPDKYKNALVKVTEQCSVKKIMQNPPTITIVTTQG